MKDESGLFTSPSKSLASQQLESSQEGAGWNRPSPSLMSETMVAVLVLAMLTRQRASSPLKHPLPGPRGWGGAQQMTTSCSSHTAFPSHNLFPYAVSKRRSFSLVHLFAPLLGHVCSQEGAFIFGIYSITSISADF